MINQENVKRIKDIMFEKAKSAGFEAEILIHEEVSSSVSVKSQEIKELSNALLDKVGVRVIKGKNEGFASTESFDDESISNCIDDALAIAEVIERDIEMSLGELENYQDDMTFNEYVSDRFHQASTDDMRTKALKLEKEASSIDDRIFSVMATACSKGQSKETYLNSRGVEKSCASNSLDIYTYLGADNKVFKKTNYDVFSGHNMMDLDEKSFAKAIVDDAIALLDAKSIPSQKIPVLLSREQAPRFIGALTGALSAKAIDQKTALFGMCEGEQIASKIITIRDRPRLENHAAATPFDSEGYPTSDKVLIEKGVCKTILTDKYHAEKMKLPHTANGQRSPGSPVGIGAHLLSVDLGDKTFEELVNIYPKVFVVDDFGGSPSAVTGEFSGPAEGHLYENGKRKHALHDVAIAGNLKEVVKNIVALGNEYKPNYSGRIQCPYILVSQMDLSGTDSTDK